MDLAHLNWAVIGLGIDAALLVAWIYEAWRWRPSLWAAFVGFGHLFVACVASATPFRAYLDPHYPGYHMGFLHGPGGWETSLLATTVFVGAALSAFVAVRNRQGFAMWFVAATSGFLVMNLGGAWVETVSTNISDNTMQFGEYLTIPALIATPIMFVLFICPFLIGVSQAPQRARA
jgi:hypothetical protein